MVRLFSILALLSSSLLFSHQHKGKSMDCNESCSISSGVHINMNAQTFGIIDARALATLIASKVPMVILDARSAQYDDGKRIANALSLSYEASAEQAAKLIPTKQSLIVVYCSNSHCPASGYLAKRLASFGYTNILEYEAGIQDWINTGYPVQGS